MPVEPALRDLPEKPVIDEPNYGWTGKLGDHPCLLIGDRELEWDKDAKTMVLDTRRWSGVAWSAPQASRLRRFLDTAPRVGETILIYVYKDIGQGVTSTGEHQAKRGQKQFTGRFRIVERDRDWFRALLLER